MIRIESIAIKEFRGIRDLTLKFKGENFGICGPNGTGKSGVVDALEFALTGNVSRLSGEGRGNISLKTHGPHVDCRNAPDKARVSVTITIPSLSKTTTIERTVKAPAEPQVSPSDDAILAVLRQVQSHPEAVLSRRELIKYVLATPGDRAKEVQALLQLDQVEKVRIGLQKIANACEREAKTMSENVTAAKESLLTALGIPTLESETVLAAANAQRTVLGLASIYELTDTNSLKDGLATAEPAQTHRIAKAQALEDIRIARNTLAELTGHATADLVSAAQGELRTLASDPLIVAGVTTENFYTIGLQLIVEAACPFCDTAWNPTALKKHVEEKILHLKEVSRRREVAERKLVPLTALLRRVQSSLEMPSRYAASATPPVDFQSVKGLSATCSASIATISAFLPIADTIAAVAGLTSLANPVYEAIAELERVVGALPEPSKQGAAREWLIIVQERLDQYRTAKRKQKAANEHATRVRQMSNLYAAASDGVLAGIYASVQNDFAALYRAINRGDEDRFAARLEPSMGKLGFDVDFYGRGFFPPGAYHSEGHQDGMGLCLYLALMRHIHGPGFTFAILDDVLMSVDAGHRREVCTLLKNEFPKTQFVMTTHDHIWLRHMKTENLIGRRAFAHFRKWDVDHGPTDWADHDVWTEIDNFLKQSDVRSAAALLRYYLEYISAEICHRLRAPVEYRGDAQYQLGDLLPSAVNQMRKTLTKAKDAANSWGQREKIAEIESLKSVFDERANRSQVERWQVNAAIHFNSWVNFNPRDFEPVVTAHRDLLISFACSVCSSLLWIAPEREAQEALRCDCGVTSINLKKK